MNKLILILAICAIVLISCNTTPKSETNLSSAPSSSIDRLAIADTIMRLFNDVTAAAKAADADKLLPYYSRSAAFRFISSDGREVKQYDTFDRIVRDAYTGFAYQEIVLNDSSLEVISSDDVLLIVSGIGTSVRKDSSKYRGPIALTLHYKRETDGWKILSFHESQHFNKLPLKK
jgi:ketosteroid isomerase-like protein